MQINFSEVKKNNQKIANSFEMYTNRLHANTLDHEVLLVEVEVQMLWFKKKNTLIKTEKLS